MNEEEINQELAELLENWDNGEIIHTIEMGGMGPGYEQAIHIVVFEQLRELVEAKPSRADEDYNWDKLNPIFDKALPRLEEVGPSGAQWGAAKSVASSFYLKGYRAAKESFPEDRKIMVSNRWPKSPGDSHLRSEAVKS